MSKLPGRGTHKQSLLSTYVDNSPMNRALWNLSIIMREIAQSQRGVAEKETPTATTRTGLEVSSAEGSTND